MSGGWYCITHDPDRVTDLAEWRHRGGKGRSNKRRPAKQLPGEVLSLREVQATLCRALRRVEAGEMEPGPANALSSLGRAIAAVVQAGDLEERLTELEKSDGLDRKGWRA